VQCTTLCCGVLYCTVLILYYTTLISSTPLPSLLSSSGVKHTKYIDGEPVDDEEDDNEDYIFTSPIDNMDVSSFFLQVMMTASVRDPEMTAALQKGLGVDDAKHLKDLVKKVEDRRALLLAETN
jgi:hypothetical protein